MKAQGEARLTIGALAKAAGVNVETVRYYQRRGLIQQPAKPLSGYRRYSQDTVGHIRFIKRAQRLGFSLREVSELLDFSAGDCDGVRLKAEKKRQRIQQQIDDLSRLRDTLDRFIDACQSGEGAADCPLVEALRSGEKDSGFT